MSWLPTTTTMCSCPRQTLKRPSRRCGSFSSGIATALVAAVIANLIVFPGGALADLPLWLRIGAAVAGFAAFLAARQSMLVGIVVAEAVLIAGSLLG